MGEKGHDVTESMTSRVVIIMTSLLILGLALLTGRPVTAAVDGSSSHQVETIYIDECVMGKYLWNENYPVEFYVCVAEQSAIQDGGTDYYYGSRFTRPQPRLTNAIKIKCLEGTYMCVNYEQQQRYFEPCACRYDGNNNFPVYSQLQGKNNHQVQYSGASGIGGLYGRQSFGQAATGELAAEQLQELKLDDAGFRRFSKEYRPQQLQQLQQLKREKEEIKVEEKLKELDSLQTIQAGSLPSNGCPDLYRLYPNSHMFRGTPRSLFSLVACQQACLDESTCVGIDWNKLASTPDARRCFLVFPESARYGSLPFSDLCCDHYRRTSCLPQPPQGTDVVIALSRQAIVPIRGDSRVGVGGRVVAREGGEVHPRPVSSLNVEDIVDPSIVSSNGESPIIGEDVEDILKEGGKFVFVGRSEAPTGTRPIPDSGCPYSLKMYADSSHPFGRNVTLPGDENNTAEKCKYWCLVRSYCPAVDFNYITRTCYLIRELHSDLITKAPGVTHYQKTRCAPPLKCWVSALSRVQTLLDTRVTDLATPSSDCQGLCFVKQSAGTNAVIERGCDITPGLRVGCSVQGSIGTNFQTVVCYCDTNRCNGLSILALVAQMLYLPLDGDATDHSGLGRHGLLTTSLTGPLSQPYPSYPSNPSYPYPSFNGAVPQSSFPSPSILGGVPRSSGSSRSVLGGVPRSAGPSPSGSVPSSSGSSPNYFQQENVPPGYTSFSIGGVPSGPSPLFRGMSSTGRMNSFTCLDKTVNCSLLILGDQCIEVPSLGLTAYTALEILSKGASPNFDGRESSERTYSSLDKDTLFDNPKSLKGEGSVSFTYVPQVTFVVYYKRVGGLMPTKQGVFGNSRSPNMEATWAIYAENSTHSSTAGVITDETRLRSVEDYKYSRAEDDVWHQHVLSYDGHVTPLPTLQYFVDGLEMIGNARLERGNISVRTQPVTVGCVDGLNFVGLIDEARIFSTNLDKLDISAIDAMRDTNFW